MLHEIKDQTGLIAGLTKWSTGVTDPVQINAAVGAAFAHLHTGRPRPVGLEVPQDVLEARADPLPGNGACPMQRRWSRLTLEAQIANMAEQSIGAVAHPYMAAVYWQQMPALR